LVNAREAVVRQSKKLFKPTTFEIPVILNYAPGLTAEDFKTHIFELKIAADTGNYVLNFGNISLRKFFYERYYHISQGIKSYFLDLKETAKLPDD